jgi:hypothetical protein
LKKKSAQIKKNGQASNIDKILKEKQAQYAQL